MALEAAGFKILLAQEDRHPGGWNVDNICLRKFDWIDIPKNGPFQKVWWDTIGCFLKWWFPPNHPLKNIVFPLFSPSHFGGFGTPYLWFNTWHLHHSLWFSPKKPSNLVQLLGDISASDVATTHLGSQGAGRDPAGPLWQTSKDHVVDSWGGQTGTLTGSWREKWLEVQVGCWFVYLDGFKG